MRRRRFLELAVVGGAMLGGCSLRPIVQSASGGVRRVGRLAGNLPNPTDNLLDAALRRGLRELGWIEGENVVVDARNADGDDRTSEPAADLISQRTEVVVVSNATVARAVQVLSTTLPIVNDGNGDLVDRGLASSRARPGGNVTGMTAIPRVGYIRRV